MTPNKYHVRICSSLAVLEDKVNNNYDEAERCPFVLTHPGDNPGANGWFL